MTRHPAVWLFWGLAGGLVWSGAVGVRLPLPGVAAGLLLTLAWARGPILVRVALAAAVLGAGVAPGDRPRPAATADLGSPAWLRGRARGPVRRTPYGVSLEVATAAGNRPLRLSTPVPLAADEPGIHPCDLVEGEVRPGDGAWRGSLASVGIEAADDCASPWRWVDLAHQRARSAIGDGRGRGLVRAMVLGDRSGLAAADTEAFRRAGVSHVLAVSGLHLAVVVALVFASTRRLLALCSPRASPVRGASALAVLACVGFAALTGARVSTVRAGGMVLCVLLALAAHRRMAAVAALAVIGSLILIAEPETLGEAGFQLSMAATAILVLGRRSAAKSRWRRVVATSLQASMTTALATAPFTAHHFGEVAWIGVLANLVIVPIVELGVLPLGFLGAVLVPIAPRAAEPCLAVSAFLAEGAADLAACFGELASPWTGPQGSVEIAACVALALALARHRGRWAVAAAVVLVAAVSWPRSGSTGTLRVTFLDVGQGDAALIEWPDGGAWLIDAGPPSSGGGALARGLRRRGIGTIESVIVSHAHPDHDGGLAALPDDLRVMRAASTATGAITAAPLGRLDRGTARIWLLTPVFGDGPRARGDPLLSVNDNSIAVLLEYAGRRILFLGDLEEEGEERLLLAYPSLGAVDVVKVGHHGSSTSSTPALVERLRPRLAVISCGAYNTFGHPAGEVLARWSGIGAEVLRTDRHGDVEVTVSPNGAMRVRTGRAVPTPPR